MRVGSFFDSPLWAPYITTADAGVSETNERNGIVPRRHLLQEDCTVSIEHQNRRHRMYKSRTYSKRVTDGFKSVGERNQNYRQDAVTRLVGLAKPSRRQKK